jgi:aryl-alcohol dehydrogenase-like predicted oxidoreductase
MFPDGYTEVAVRAATEASLKRLRVEALDLTQLHCVPAEVLRRGEVFGWLRTLKREGVIATSAPASSRWKRRRSAWVRRGSPRSR